MPLALVTALVLAAMLARFVTSEPTATVAASPDNPVPARQDTRGGSKILLTESNGDETITLVTAGIASSLPNGGDVPVSGGLLAALTLNPGNDRYSRQLDVYLHDAQASPAAIDGAAVLATGRMRYMDHGTFRQVAVEAGDGQYVVPLTFPMPGEWEVALQIDAPREQGKLTLNIDLFN